MDDMTAIVANTAAFAALTAVVHAIRPQWDTPGIRDILGKAAATHPYPDIATVAVSAARDPSAATPAVIAVRLANGWTATHHDDVKPRTPTAPLVEDMRCRCGAWVVRSESHQCARRADPDHAHQAATAARQAARATRPAEKETA